MAIYHLSMKPIARSGGRSAVASAAYRACQKLTNERDGLTHDFTRKGGLDLAEIVIRKDSKETGIFFGESRSDPSRPVGGIV